MNDSTPDKKNAKSKTFVSYDIWVIVNSCDGEQPEFEPVQLGASPGFSLVDLLASHGFKIPFDCGGLGTCGKCRALIARFKDSDEYALFETDKNPTNLQFTDTLMCQIKVDCDLVISLPPSCFPDAKHSPIVFEEETKLDQSVQIPCDHALGVAVDLGTTTLVISLLDLTTKTVIDRATCRNPQIETGGDIITRIQFATTSASRAQKMQTLVLDRIDEIIAALASRHGLASEKIKSVSVAGNTAMTWFFCGLDSSGLGQWPFRPPFTVVVPGENAPNVKLQSCPAAKIEIVPVLAGFAGGDIIAGILSLQKSWSGPDNKNGWTKGPALYFDLGTNGEIALLTDKEILVTATAAGPAFEGAGLRFGMTASPGAIEGVDFSGSPYWLSGRPSTDTLLVCGGETPRGICGSGLLDAVAELLRGKMIDFTGRFRSSAIPCHPWEAPSVQRLFRRLGYYEGYKAFRLTDTTADADVWLLQSDIRAAQLAIGAIRAGTRILLREASLEESDLEYVYLAGLFGNHVQLDNAKYLQLFPSTVTTDRVVYCGNAALRGTEEYAFDSNSKALAIDIARTVRHIDLATVDDFREVFIDSLAFPPAPW